MRALIIATLAAFFVSGCSGVESYQLEINDAEFQVEVADTDEERARGLMFRESMAETSGMLFVFDDLAIRAFYMRNTEIPLSIAYIDERLVIREIYDMEPFSLESIISRFPAKYALELNQGTFETFGIRPGDRIRLSDALSRRISD